MTSTEVLDRIPAVAQALQEDRGSDGPRWTLRAREPEQKAWQEVQLGGWTPCRNLALELNDLGLHVCVEDERGRVRLRMYPGRPD